MRQERRINGKKDRMITEIKEEKKMRRKERERQTYTYTAGVGTVNVCGTHCHLLSARRETIYISDSEGIDVCVLE